MFIPLAPTLVEKSYFSNEIFFVKLCFMSSLLLLQSLKKDDTLRHAKSTPVRILISRKK